MDGRRVDSISAICWWLKAHSACHEKRGSDHLGNPCISVASKALLPPPAKWEGLSDVELRYRQRYVDLWANPGVMRVLKLRMQIVQEIRHFHGRPGISWKSRPR